MLRWVVVPYVAWATKQRHFSLLTSLFFFAPPTEQIFQNLRQEYNRIQRRRQLEGAFNQTEACSSSDAPSPSSSLNAPSSPPGRGSCNFVIHAYRPSLLAFTQEGHHHFCAAGMCAASFSPFVLTSLPVCIVSGLIPPYLLFHEAVGVFRKFKYQIQVKVTCLHFRRTAGLF